MIHHRTTAFTHEKMRTNPLLGQNADGIVFGPASDASGVTTDDAVRPGKDLRLQIQRTTR
jgi:hypothetical protein